MELPFYLFFDLLQNNKSPYGFFMQSLGFYSLSPTLYLPCIWATSLLKPSTETFLPLDFLFIYILLSLLSWHMSYSLPS